MITTLQYLLHSRKFHLIAQASAPRSTSVFSCGRSHYPHAGYLRHAGFHVLALYSECAILSSIMNKTTTIRFSDTDKMLLRKLSEHLGITQSAVVKQALHALARKEGVSVERVEKKHI